MNSRFFRSATFHFRTNLLRLCRRFSNTQPPILLLTETHLRPAANQILYRSLPDLKKLEYNTFMCEGMQAGKTLEEKLLKIKQSNHLIHELTKHNSKLIDLMNLRYQMTCHAFTKACKPELTKVFPKLNPSEYNILIDFMIRHDPTSNLLYERLLADKFSYKNLDEDYYPDASRPFATRQDLDFRDEQYVMQISDAYKQGKGVMSILGALHVSHELQEFFPDSSNHYMFGKRQLIGDRLHALGIPYIGLFPFRSDHTPTEEQEIRLQKKIFPATHLINPLDIYAVDVAGSTGVQHFLHVIHRLIDAHKNNELNDIQRQGIALK